MFLISSGVLNFLFLVFIFLDVLFVFSRTYYLSINLKDETKVTNEVTNINEIDSDKITIAADAGEISHTVNSLKLLKTIPIHSIHYNNSV